MNKLISFVLMTVFWGCAAKDDSHVVAQYYDKSASEQENLNLPFNAFIVGVEKGNRTKVGQIRECFGDKSTPDCLDIDSPYFVQHREIRDALRPKYQDQHRPTYVSHIARFDGKGGPCYLYNVYSENHGCSERYVKTASQSFVDAGWPALSFFGKQLATYIEEKHPTHIVVYTMGWNTMQAEAMENFRDLASNLKAAGRSDEKFDPLFLGITWPSTGSPTIPATDFGIKAKDAEEVGALWENILINREIWALKEKGRFKVVVVGHSFGARASSRAVFSRALVTPETGKAVDLLIGLQGAYSYQRYGKYGEEDQSNGIEGAPYRDFSDMVGLTVLTASRNDTAVTRADHAKYFVGSSAAMTLSKTEQHGQTFIYDVTGDDGRLSAVRCDSQRVLYIDASSVIKGNKPGTVGGAHSMIYTPEIGNLVYQLIHACT
jgi:hypothetical protein